MCWIRVGRAGADSLAVVVGPGRDDVAAEARAAAPDARIFVQAERLGTAHAVLAARDALGRGYDDVLVLFADTPLVRPETFAHLREKLADGAGIVALGFEPDDPTGYGRLLTEQAWRARSDSRAQGRQRRRTGGAAPATPA